MRLKKQASCHPLEVHYAKGLCATCYSREHGRTYGASYRARNPERILGYLKKYREKNREKSREYMRLYRVSNREKIAKKAKARRSIDRKTEALYIAKTRYGVAPEHCDKIIELRKVSCCEICDKPASEARYGTLHIDHPHGEKRMRGLLCGQCNTAIGLLKDDPILLQKAIDYLDTDLCRRAYA